MKEKKRQEIFVERGMTDHHRIVLAGEGDQLVKFFRAPANSVLTLASYDV